MYLSGKVFHQMTCENRAQDSPLPPTLQSIREFRIAHRRSVTNDPTASRTGGVSLQAFGTPGLLFRTRGRTGFEGEVAFPKRGRERFGPGRSAPSRWGARSHREKLLRGAEAVGGGRRRWVGEAIALLSPKSKVLGGAINRARRRGSLCRLPSASLRLCGEPRHGAPA